MDRVRLRVRVKVRARFFFFGCGFGLGSGLGIDLERIAEVLAEAVAGGALDGTARRGDVGLDGGGVVAARELLGLGLGLRVGVEG